VKRMGSVLIIMALLFALMGCAGGNTPIENNEVEQTLVPSQDNQQADELTPSPSTVAAPSSEASESVNEIDTSKAGAEVETSLPSLPLVAPPSAPDTETATPAVDSITLSIIGNAKWGTLLSSENVTLAEGDTAADVLKRAAKAHRLSYEIKGSGTMTYVEGIDGLYEFDDGPASGWIFRVNGKAPDVGSGSYKLKPGDRLEWFYTSEDEAVKEDKEPAS
jgi:hypothetical protein